MTPIDLQRWQWLGFALLVGFLLWLLGPILTPFVISALLGWLGDPLVDRLERSGRSRSISVVIVFVLMTGLLGLALLVVLPLLSAALVSRTRRRSSIPSMPGILMSNTPRSGGLSVMDFKAAAGSE